jgi:hypothetical protein
MLALPFTAQASITEHLSYKVERFCQQHRVCRAEKNWKNVFNVKIGEVASHVMNRMVGGGGGLGSERDELLFWAWSERQDDEER